MWLIWVGLAVVVSVVPVFRLLDMATSPAGDAPASATGGPGDAPRGSAAAAGSAAD